MCIEVMAGFVLRLADVALEHGLVGAGSRTDLTMLLDGHRVDERFAALGAVPDAGFLQRNKGFSIEVVLWICSPQ